MPLQFPTDLYILIPTAILVAVCVTASIQWGRRSAYSFLPGPPLKSIFGYLTDVHNPLTPDWHFEMSERYGHVARLKGGMFKDDGLYISDPLALNSILIRDQNNFPESTEFSGLFGVVHHGENFASVHGREHKRQRKLMNPALTASTLSNLVPTFYTIAHELRNKLSSEILRQPSNHQIDILDWLARTALEFIAQGGIGHTFNSFENSEEFTEFHEALKTVLPSAGKLFLLLPYFETWRNLRPVWLRRFLSKTVSCLPWPALRKFKNAVDTMHPVCASVYNKKKTVFEKGGIDGLEENSPGGTDLTTLLMQKNSEAEEEDRVPDDTVIANMSSMILGGQETTSGALSRLILLIATDPCLQSRLREDLVQAKELSGTDLDYNELNNLSLLDAVCKETLRLYSPIAFVWRRTLQDTIVPLHFPVRNVHTGSEMRELRIARGTQVYVGVGAANQSTAIWGPDAGVFRPERWLDTPGAENATHGVKMPGIYSNIMTFLGGRRSCPGMKFALLEIKLVIAVLLQAFTFAADSDKIEWRMGITLAPYVKGSEGEGQKMPMRIESL